MTILRIIYIAVLLLLCSLAGGAQVRPDQFPLQTNIGGFNFEIYSQYGGVNTKSMPYYMKLYYAPNIDSAWQAFTFTDSIGVADSLRMQFIKDNRGRVWYTDAQGDALLLKDTAQAVGNVYVLPTTADTSTVASPVEGDIAIVGSDTLLFYETYWLMFAGGAGGIYGGSGTVPASTWAELLGSLIFDIDSLGSFTVGDIDEKNTGAKISISNAAGNDGQITIKSGSGAGYTDATVEVNNYSLPGNKPNSLSLAAGDYLWLVSEAGVGKGQDSTGWLHIDSLLNGYVQGSGTSGTLPIWTGAGTLGNSSLTEGSGVLSSSLTGAMKLPAGTDAQDPVWANGMLRFNTTTGGFQGYNGSEKYLPWADADNFTNTYIPYSDGAKLTSSSNFKWTGGLNIGNISTANASRTIALRSDDYFAQMYNAAGTSKISIRATGKIQFENTGTVEGIEWGANTILVGSGGVYLRATSNNAYRFLENGVERGCFGANVIGSSALNQKGLFLSSMISGANSSSSLTIQGYDARGTGDNLGSDLILIGGRSKASTAPSANINIYNGHQGNTDDLGSFSGYPGNVTFYVYVDTASLSPSATYKLIEYGGNHSFPHLRLYNLSATTDGVKTLTMEADTLKYRVENLGTISTSTDGSGDIVVAHGMGTTPTSVQVTVTGTTPYVVTVHTIGSTNFTVRFYDMAGAAVTSTAVTATWHCKT